MSTVVEVTPLITVNFNPATTLEEIVQNVRCIISTVKGSVPLDRDFGLDFEGLDTPMPQAQMLFRMHLIEAISKYEPRVQIKSITFTKSAVDDGALTPHVTVEIADA